MVQFASSHVYPFVLCDVWVGLPLIDAIDTAAGKAVSALTCCCWVVCINDEDVTKIKLGLIKTFETLCACCSQRESNILKERLL